MSKIVVSAQILKWAIERKGLTEQSLKKKFPKISEWLNGSDSPTMRQLEDFSKATSTPFGYFFLQSPPTIELHIPHFRTVTDGKPNKPSAELIETVQSMELRQDWVREYLQKRGMEPLDYVGSLHSNVKTVEAAQHIRTVLGLNDSWANAYPIWDEALRGLRNAMEDIGILVVVNGIVGNNTNRALDTEEFRGFVLCDQYAPLVFINGADSKAAQMFTLAHELVHIFFGKSASFDLKDMQPADDHSERQCNEIAAEFLVPQERLKNLWDLNKNKKDKYSVLAQAFKVSALVIARRALDIRLITKSNFFDFYNQYITDIKKNKSKKSGGDFYASQNLRVGRSFGDFIVTAVKEGSLLYSDAYRLTGLRGASFDKFANMRKLKKTGSD